MYTCSDHSNPDQRPKLVINCTTGGIPPNPVPSIANFSPGSLTLDCNGVIDEADLDIISSNFGMTTYAAYPRYDVTGYGIVDVYDITVVSNNILE